MGISRVHSDGRPVCRPAQASGIEFSLSSLCASSAHPSITNAVFPSLPVGVFGFEHSHTNKPKPSKLISSLPLEPSDHGDQGQRCPHQKVRPFSSHRLDQLGSGTDRLKKQTSEWCHLLHVALCSIPADPG